MEKGIYSQIAPCIFAIIIDALGFGLVYPVMTSIFTSVDSPMLPVNATSTLRHFYLGLGFMLYPLCMFFGTSFMGDLSDDYGRRRVLIFCMAGISLSFLIMGIGVSVHSILLLMIGRALSGLVAGSQPIAQAAVADLSTAENKAQNMSILSISYCLGSILGPVLGGITSDKQIVSWFTFSTPFYIATVFAALAVIWLSTSFKETFVAEDRRSFSMTRPVQLFIKAFQHLQLRNLTIVFLLMQIGFSLYFQFIIVVMKYDHNYSNFLLGTLQGMIGIGFALGILIGVPLALKYWKLLPVTIVSGILTGVFQIIAAVTFQDMWQWPLAIFVAAFDIIAFTGMLTLFSDAVSKKAQGFAMGIANAAMALSWAITGLGSNLINLIGTRGLIFVGGLILIASFIFLSKQSSPKRVSL